MACTLKLLTVGSSESFAVLTRWRLWCRAVRASGRDILAFLELCKLWAAEQSVEILFETFYGLLKKLLNGRIYCRKGILTFSPVCVF